MNKDGEDLSPRELFKRRQETLLRLERFWALANVLAAGEKDAGGVRGVTYARAKVADLMRSGNTRVDARYPLLSRQVQYGAIGMYGAVADGMRYLNRDSFTLTADLGEVAAEAFLDETKIPMSLKAAIVEDRDISVSVLKEWGERAHVEAEVGPEESKCLYDALHSNPIRSRMAMLLKRYPFKNGEMELARIKRILRVLDDDSENRDLAEAMGCILAYEDCYRLAVLSLERLLWLCRRHAVAASFKLSDLKDDLVIKLVSDKLPEAFGRFQKSLQEGQTELFSRDLERLTDVRTFLESAASKSDNPQDMVVEVMRRHTDVQRGKFDRGRRKMPWLEINGDKICMTMTRAGGLNREALKPDNIAPHPYRLNAADAMISASAKGAAR